MFTDITDQLHPSQTTSVNQFTNDCVKVIRQGFAFLPLLRLLPIGTHHAFQTPLVILWVNMAFH